MRAWLATTALLAGCYASHTVSPPGPPLSDDGGSCALGPGTELNVMPPLRMGHYDYVRLNGLAPDPAISGVRLRIDTCPMADSPCPHDVSIIGVGADIADRIHVPPPGAIGFLDWDGLSTLYFLAVDARECATCGGEIEILAGALAPPIDAATHVSNGGVDCRDDCNDYGGVVVESHGTSLTASQGDTRQVGAFLLRVTEDRTDSCRRCHCRAADEAARGLFVSMQGVFGA